MKIIRKALCFILIFLGLFLALDQFFFDKSNTSPVWEMIQDSKSKELDILFIGSSHAFTAINPIIINEALGIRTAVLGTSAQPMDLAYADLKILLKYKKPKIIVFEALKTKDLAKEICELGREGYLYNDIDAVRNPFYRIQMVTDILDYSRWLEGFSQLFRPMLTWKRLGVVMAPPESYGNKSFGNLLGFLPKEGIYRGAVKSQLNLKKLEQENFTAIERLSGDSSIIMDEKESFYFFHKFLQLTDKENIPVYIIKSPVARSGYVDLMKDIEKVSSQHKSVRGIYNYNTQLTSIGLTAEDFYDSGHLNRVGAGKFTIFLTDRIGKKLHKKPDYSKVCYYKDEYVESLSNGLYRYHVETFPNSSIKFTVKDRRGNILKETPYSQKNYIDMERVGYNKVLFFKIKPKKKFQNTVSPQERDFRFMKDQGVLQDYSRDYLETRQQDNEIHLTNHYQDVPVQYAFYVFRNGNRIYQQAYSQNNTFHYKFTVPGRYEIKAEIRTKEKFYDFKSAKITPIIFGADGLRVPE